MDNSDEKKPRANVDISKLPPASSKTDVTYAGDIKAIFDKSCVKCHGAEKPKKGFRVDRLSTDFANEANQKQWLTALKRIKAGEMPPASQPPPPEQEVQALSVS